MQLSTLREDRRKVDRSKRKTFEPISLNQRHQEILNLYTMGLRETEIASALGVTPRMVEYTVNSTLGQEKMSLIRGARDFKALDAAEQIQKLIPKALAVYEKILSEEGDGLSGAAHGGANIGLQKATADVVMKEFSGLTAPKKLLVGHAHLTKEMLEELKANSLIAAKECGLVAEETLELLGE